MTLGLEILLSGALGALIATLLNIFYKEYQRGRQLAKERVGKVYGPLLLIYESNQVATTSDTVEDQFIYSETEEEDLNRIILDNFHLIEDKRKDVLRNLYHLSRVHGEKSGEEIIQAVKDGYDENAEKAGLSSRKRLEEN